MGDYNAKVGGNLEGEVGGRFGLGDMNENGEWLTSAWKIIWSLQTPCLNTMREGCTRGTRRMDTRETKLITLCSQKDFGNAY